jgi:hypothetical protein
MRSLEDLWKAAGCPAESLARIAIESRDPVLPSPFKIGEAAALGYAQTLLVVAERGDRPALYHMNSLKGL